MATDDDDDDDVDDDDMEVYWHICEILTMRIGCLFSLIIKIFSSSVFMSVMRVLFDLTYYIQIFHFHYIYLLMAVNKYALIIYIFCFESSINDFSNVSYTFMIYTLPFPNLKPD